MFFKKNQIKLFSTNYAKSHYHSLNFGEKREADNPFFINKIKIL